MKHLETNRLILVPCSLEIAKKMVLDRKGLGEMLSAHIPEHWPTDDLKGYIPYVIEALEMDTSEYGWGIWIAINKSNKVVVGDIGFKGKPDHCGVIEIGYGILPQFRKQGFASEAAKAITDWAFAENKSVMKINAECDMSNLSSINVLQKINMKCVSETDGVQKWELVRRRWREGK